MKIVKTVPAPPSTLEKFPASTTPETPVQNASKSRLSAGTKAFIHQMAENLNTHDPDRPKGRLKLTNGFSSAG